MNCRPVGKAVNVQSCHGFMGGLNKEIRRLANWYANRCLRCHFSMGAFATTEKAEQRKQEVQGGQEHLENKYRSSV